MSPKMLAPADKPERVPLDDLKPNPHNSRKHSEEQLEMLAQSLVEFNWSRPILRDEHGFILYGHGVWGAAQRLRNREDTSRGEGYWNTAPVITARGWTEAQKRAYIIADNRLAELSEFDDDVLRAELAALRDLDFPLELTGFTAADLEQVFTNRAARGDPDSVPMAPVNPVTRTGDLWRLGDHWVICGDCTDPAVVERLLKGRPAAMCFTDPPYGRDYKYRNHDDGSNDSNAQLVAKAFALAPEGKVWTPGKNNFARDIARFGKTSIAIWHKGFAAARNGLGGASTVEPVLIIKATRHKLPNDYLHFTTERAEVDGENLRDLHPCPKPVALFAHLIECLSKPKERIYEPFGGSGTTLIAAHMQKRPCSAVELDPAYVDVIVKRWTEFTGFEAFLDDGRTFTDVAAERLSESPVEA